MKKVIKTILNFKLEPKWRFISLCLLGSLGLSCEYLAPHWWFFDNLCSFKVQYLLVLVVGIAGLILLYKMWKTALVFGVFFCWSACALIPFFIPKQTVANTSDSLKLMLFNVNLECEDFDGTKEVIDQVSPDILILQEVSEEWLKKLEPGLIPYSYRFTQPQSDCFGMAVYSKIPAHIELATFLGRRNDWNPTLTADFKLNGKLLKLIAVHPLPPARRQYKADRDQLLTDLADHVAQLKSSTIIMGDLNTTPWSPVFKKLIETSGLINSMKGGGIQPSWPMRFYLFPLLIPLDHCLVSPDISVLSRIIGPTTKSDHAPLIVKIAI